MHLNRHPERKELLWFGAGLPVFPGLVGYLVWRRTGSEVSRQALWALGGFLALLFWLVRGARRPIFLGFGYVSYPIGFVMSRVLLLIVFLGVVTPTGILMRLFGKDLLGLRIDRDRASYWMPHEGPHTSEDYFRQS